MVAAFEELSTVSVGRGKGTRAVLPGGWGLVLQAGLRVLPSF